MARFVQPNAYHPIGFIRKIKGLKGMMVVHLDYPDTLNLTCVFFYRHHTYVPYFVDRWEQEGTGARLFLKGICNRTDAEAFRLMPLFIAADEVIQAWK